MVTEVKSLNSDVQGHTTHHCHFLVSIARDQKQVIKSEFLTGFVQPSELEIWTKHQKQPVFSVFL